MAELALGTAQFGLSYGINNKKGRIPENEVFEILRYARQHDIVTLDTASSYGASENVIGTFIKDHPDSFKIISKYVAADGNAKDGLLTSLKKLNVSKVNGFLIHHFEDFQKDPAIWKQLVELRSKGLTEKVGFSLYYPSELDLLLKNGIKPDIVNIPYNILDQRFKAYIPKMKDLGIEVQVRSVFLQGLLLMSPSEIDEQFADIKDKIKTLNRLANKAEVSRAAACLGFAALNGKIDKIVIGVDGIDHLKNNIEAFNARNKVMQIHDELANLIEYNEKIILPTNWS
jgi:aryl-alcohol dehydrogenase-like predicted oxidoreductase